MTATYTLESMITALTAAGYRVGFTLDPLGYVASVSREPLGDGGYEHDAIAVTLTEALATAMPAGSRLCACDHLLGSHWEIAEAGGPRSGCAILGCTCRGYREYIPAPVVPVALLADCIHMARREGFEQGQMSPEQREASALAQRELVASIAAKVKAARGE